MTIPLKTVVFGRTIDKAEEGYDAARVAHEVVNLICKHL